MKMLIKKMPFFLSKTIIFFVIASFSYSNLSGNPIQRFDSISNEIEKNYFLHGEKSRNMIKELYLIANNSSDSISLISQCLYQEGMFSFAQGTVDSTLPPRIRKQMERIDKTKYPFQHALLSYSLGAYLSATGDYSEAFAISLDAVDQFKQLNDSNFVAKSLNILGTICSHISLFGMSKDYYEEALNWSTPNHNDYYRLRVNSYRLDLLGNDMDAGIKAMDKIIAELEAKNDTSVLIIAYSNQGAFYFKNGDNEKSYYYWSMAEKIAEQLDNSRFNSSLYQYLGAYHVFSDQDYKKALHYFSLSKGIAEKNQSFVQLSSIYENISQTYELMNNIDSAYYYTKEQQMLTQKLIPNTKAIEAYQAYVSTFLEASENKLTIAEQQVKISNRQLITVVMIAVTLILLTILLLQQKRLKENENRELSKQLEHEKKIQQLQKEKQDEVIEAKTREITSYSLLLSNKNNILKEILNINTLLAKNKKGTEEYTKKINDIIKSNFHIEEDWKDFKVHFENVHPSFFDRLKQYCGDLTENNMRICAYYRLGMSTKQIAQVLHITPASVSIHRHRIKKKLGLNEKDELDDVLRNI